MEEQLADIFTKPLPASMFQLLRQKIGVCSFQSKEECYEFAFSTAVNFTFTALY